MRCVPCAVAGQPLPSFFYFSPSLSFVRLFFFSSSHSFFLVFFFDRKYNLENSTIKHFLEMSKTTDATHNKPKRHKKQMQQNYQFHKRTRTNTLTHTHMLAFVLTSRTFTLNSKNKMCWQNDPYEYDNVSAEN